MLIKPNTANAPTLVGTTHAMYPTNRWPHNVSIAGVHTQRPTTKTTKGDIHSKYSYAIILAQTTKIVADVI